MEPQPNAAEQPSKIFINPKFAKAHINPMFLSSSGMLRRPEIKQDETTHHSTIHLNPAFLDKLRIQQVSPPIITTTVPNTISQSRVTTSLPVVARTTSASPSKITFSETVNPIIKNTRRKLVRATTSTNDAKVAVVAKSIGREVAPIAAAAAAASTNHQLAPLVRIGKNKLVRSSVPNVMGLENVKPRMLASTLPERKSLRIDRRVAPTLRRFSIQKLNFVKRYALSRINGITPKKVIITDPKLLKLKRNPMLKSPEKPRPGKSSIAYASKNKQLVLVNINGVLYRSSTNKLQKSVTPSPSSIGHTTPPKPARKTKEHFLIIRGMRFALDRNGMKLRSVGNATVEAAATSKPFAPEPRLNRIDIGGLTYKARKDGIFIRTDNHRTRNHLSMAKQRSIQVLASKLRKCNEPCHIYRRLGKCLAHQRGKCPKVHDPKHVSICQKFLRGECILDGCSLSHDVSLEKMPVCTFFLEGRCMRDVCPYLHKKVSEKERICDAFLNGFCALADKCPNRHVFQCPEFEQKGKCDRTRCPYPHGKKEVKGKKADIPSTTTASPEVEEPKPKPRQTPTVTASVRYYQDEGQSSRMTNDDKTGEFSASERNQLKRMLGEVEKMKQRYKEDISTQSAERTVDVSDQIVSIQPTAANSVGSEACDSLSEPTLDDVKQDEAEAEEDARPPVFRRKALGTLPAFIPI
ncbi:zinc finger CCCH domain-containing protein 3 [Anopheles maculipalpis]|uniref:zinc finger CCCH domain-containing protein 3 n=1 Tax=Anopheles maculipalpis TaxID=1496333 RepID=UPI002158E74A|nr:zinc finger CCCH domain-containing protein 3 [Anopheles maculipalpis]